MIQHQLRSRVCAFSKFLICIRFNALVWCGILITALSLMLFSDSLQKILTFTHTTLDLRRLTSWQKTLASKLLMVKNCSKSLVLIFSMRSIIFHFTSHLALAIIFWSITKIILSTNIRLFLATSPPFYFLYSPPFSVHKYLTPSSIIIIIII